MQDTGVTRRESLIAIGTAAAGVLAWRGPACVARRHGEPRSKACVARGPCNRHSRRAGKAHRRRDGRVFPPRPAACRQAGADSHRRRPRHGQLRGGRCTHDAAMESLELRAQGRMQHPGSLVHRQSRRLGLVEAEEQDDGPGGKLGQEASRRNAAAWRPLLFVFSGRLAIRRAR